MNEIYTYIIYDIKNINLKNKVEEKYKDYGLRKIYKFIFCGYISKPKLEVLKIKIQNILINTKYMLTIIPTNNDNIFFFSNKRILKKKQIIQNKIYFGMKLNRKYLDFEN